MEPVSESSVAPELPDDESRIFEAARLAVTALTRQSYALWLTIACAVDLAWRQAERLKGRNTFRHILEQQGIAQHLGKTWAGQKSTASKLRAIYGKRDEVNAWRRKLKDHERIAWVAPSTIFKHCPLFKPADTDKPAVCTSPVAKLKEENIEQERIIAHLEERLAAAENDDHRFDIQKDTPDQIGRVWSSLISEDRFNKIVAATRAHYKERKPASLPKRKTPLN
jgi:hypothetical protein